MLIYKKKYQNVNDKRIQQRNLIILTLIIIFLIITTSLITFSISVFFIQLLLASLTIPLFIKKKNNNLKLYMIIFIISYIYIFWVYLANTISYGLPYYIGGSDDLKFEQQGWDILKTELFNPQKILDSHVIGVYHNSPFYVSVISILMKFSHLFDGYNTFIPRLTNVYLLIWVLLLFEYLIKKHAKFTEKNINITIIIFALSANIQYINSHVFRDTLSMFQVLLIVIMFDLLIDNIRKKNFLRNILIIVIIGFLVYVTYYTRANSLIFAGVLSLFALADLIKMKKIYLILGLIPFLLLSNFIDNIGLTKYMAYYAEYNANVVGDGLSSYVFSQPIIPFGIIMRACFGFIIPFPSFFLLFKEPQNFLLDLIMLLIYIGVVIQVIFLPFIIKRLIKFDWLALSFLTIYMGIILTTFTFRHVLFFYPFMVALGVDGYFNTKKRNRKLILFISCIYLLLIMFIYISLKLFLN